MTTNENKIKRNLLIRGSKSGKQKEIIRVLIKRLICKCGNKNAIDRYTGPLDGPRQKLIKELIGFKMIDSRLMMNECYMGKDSNVCQDILRNLVGLRVMKCKRNVSKADKYALIKVYVNVKEEKNIKMQMICSNKTSSKVNGEGTMSSASATKAVTSRKRSTGPSCSSSANEGMEKE